jgi:hypothetical protein
MKRIIALLLAGVIVFAACGGEAPPETDAGDDDPVAPIEEPELEPEPEPEPDVADDDPDVPIEEPEPEPEPRIFVSDEAEELFNVIWENRQVWEREYLFGATLIDLDFDGVPEFLVYTGVPGVTQTSEYNPETEEWDYIDVDTVFGEKATVFKLDSDGGMFEFAELLCNWRVGITGHKFIFLHTDEHGAKSWAVPYIIGERSNHGTEWALFVDYRVGEIADPEPWEARFSLFDFTGDEVSEVIKFSEKYTPHEDRTQRVVFAVNGEVMRPTAEELQEYDEKLQSYFDDLAYLEANPDDPEEKFMMFGPLMPAYPPVYRFYDLKREFEGTLTRTAYLLYPNDSEEWYLNTDEYRWYNLDDEEIKKTLIRLVNAYVTGDSDYLIGTNAFEEGAWAKPVIYLYPEETMDVEVRVTFPTGGRFTVTYPDYGDGWSVTAHPDGTLINHADGREYSYLYWDGEGPVFWDFSSGFVVKGSDTVAFFQEKLEFLGMIPREYNEFIVYWLPLMQNNAYNLITFQTTAYEQSAVLHVSPKPDSILRVFMAYIPLDEFVNIPEQRLEPFARTGFAVIEWGGTEVSG